MNRLPASSVAWLALACLLAAVDSPWLRMPSVLAAALAAAWCAAAAARTLEPPPFKAPDPWPPPPPPPAPPDAVKYSCESGRAHERA